MEPIANIILTFINVILTYFNFSTSRKKDFEDKLYQLKIDIYQDLSHKLQSHILRLDINQEPFIKLYEIRDNKKWTKYLQNTTADIIGDTIDIQNEIFKHYHILPQKVIQKYSELTELFLGFIAQSYHGDSGILIGVQDKVWDKYYDFLKTLRNDLKIEEIDSSLNERISSSKKMKHKIVPTIQNLSESVLSTLTFIK